MGGLSVRFFQIIFEWEKIPSKWHPNQLSPDLDRMDLDRIKKQIKCISYLFSNPENIEWWNSFLERLTNKQKQQRGQWILKSLPRQRPGEEIESLSAGIPPELQKLLDKETARSVVTVKKRSLYVQQQKRNKKGSQRKKTSKPQKPSQKQKQGQAQKSSKQRNNQKAQRPSKQQKQGQAQNSNQQGKPQKVQRPSQQKKTSQSQQRSRHMKQSQRRREKPKQPTRSRYQNCEGNRWQRKDTEKRPAIYYFIGHNEQKRHIWFQILYDCFSNLTLAYGALLKLIDLYQLLYFSFAVIIDLVKFFIVIDALSQWLDNQRYENAKVNVTSFIPELFILSVYQVRKLNLTPVRNKDIKLK